MSAFSNFFYENAESKGNEPPSHEPLSLGKEGDIYYVYLTGNIKQWQGALKKLGFEPDFQNRRWWTHYMGKEIVESLIKLGIKVDPAILPVGPRTISASAKRPHVAELVQHGNLFYITNSPSMRHKPVSHLGFTWNRLIPKFWAIDPKPYWQGSYDNNNLTSIFNELDKMGVYVSDDVRQALMARFST